MDKNVQNQSLAVDESLHDKIKYHGQVKMVTLLILSLLLLPTTAFHQRWYQQDSNLEKYKWTEINDDARWAARAGLQVVELNNKFYLMGGRTPIDPAILPVPGASIIWGDVWRSANKGRTWKRILDDTDAENRWPARAYFQALTHKKHMYILGGQNFNIIENPGCAFLPPGVECTLDPIPNSDFFNDVWRSRDGVRWECMTKNAGWEGRAGLSSVVFKGEIYVMGGSYNDDSSITPEGPERVYFNDVWKSRDGGTWERLIENAPWDPRAGAVVVVKGNYMYLIGGEDGFLCENPADPSLRCPPYFNDVWRSADGKNWEPVTNNAAWPSRPGHQVVVVDNLFVLFGGFGLSNDPTDPFKPSNPMDIWVSKNGEIWKKISDSPWNAKEPIEIKYDFDALVVEKGWKKKKYEVYTFGGDRETFNFSDPTNYLRVDNDVWKFAPSYHWAQPGPPEACLHLSQNKPNPFTSETTIAYELIKPGNVKIRIYNAYGKMVRELLSEHQEAGNFEVTWDGRNQHQRKMRPGIYYLKIWAGEESKTIRMLMR